MRECTYCGADVDAHDPVVLFEGDADGPLVGRFCNYACLDAHVEDEGLLEGTACVWEPGETGQEETGQEETEQGETEQGETEQGETEQGETI